MMEKLKEVSAMVEAISAKADLIMKIVQWLVNSLKDFPKFRE